MSEPWTTLAIGVAAGVAWNGASLWCLTQLLRAWLGPQPSRRRAIIWVVVKFPLLYALTFFLLRNAKVSIVGFGIGFSVVLFAAIGVLWWKAAFRNSRTSSAC